MYFLQNNYFSWAYENNASSLESIIYFQMASGNESDPSPDKKRKIDTAELDDDNDAAYEDPRCT